MAKIFGVHELALHPGADEQAFERFFREEWTQTTTVPGWKIYLLKGDCGDRTGRYLVLIEIESSETRDRIIPPNGQFTEEGQRLLEALTPTLEKWATFGSPPFSPTFTDYVVVGEHPAA